MDELQDKGTETAIQSSNGAEKAIDNSVEQNTSVNLTSAQKDAAAEAQRLLDFADDASFATDEKLKKWTRKRKIIMGIAIGVILVLVGGGVYYYYYTAKLAGDSQGGFPIPDMNSGYGDDILEGSGTTSIGIVEETFDPDYIESELYIEEVYLDTGDEVEAGTPILKISDDSIASAREELEKEVRTTDLAYRAGAVEYKQSVLTAQSDLDSATLASSQAQAVYDAAIASLDLNVSKAEEALAQAKSDITEYSDALTNDTYRTDYDVYGTYNTYVENREILDYLVGKYEIGYDKFIPDDDDDSSSSSSTGGTVSTSSKTDKYELSTLSSLYNEICENEDEYEQAQKDYDAAVSDANVQLNKLNAELPSLEADVKESWAAHDKDSVTAQSTYDMTIAENGVAQDDYDTAVKKAEETLSSLETDKEDAADNLQTFEDAIGDGYLYTESAGTVLMMACEADTDLTGGAMVLAYSNPEEITVDVSVDQADISKLSVGDTATVTIDGYGEYTGSVSYINPVSNSSSRTSITYEVIVTLDGDVTALETNLTATVLFDIGGDES